MTTAATIARENLEAHIKQGGTDHLAYCLNALGPKLRNKGPRDVEFVAYFATASEYRARFKEALTHKADKELAAIITGAMEVPSVTWKRSDRLIYDVAESLLLSRHPEAEEAMDSYLDSIDVQASTDEYAHLRVALKTAGL